MTDVQVAASTGYAGGRHSVVGPLVQMAMSQAVFEANALGIADDTPAERVFALTGVLGLNGSEYIVDRKTAARARILDAHRGLLKAHEGSKAAALHADRS